MSDQMSVHHATYELLRGLGLTTVFGNPGSTEQTFLRDFPKDFTYVLALQEASVVAMADAFSQVIGRPALVNVHTAAGLGNAMGSLVAAYDARSPLIITAGQQHRHMMITEPYLTNRDETLLPRPWVKWAYQPVRAQDVPAAFMRAYAVALQPPAGPVFLSIPMDDWAEPALGPAVIREVSKRVAPDAARLSSFAERIDNSSRPALVFGPEVDRAGGWLAAVALAEKLKAPVYNAPLSDRVSFPEDHPLFQGALPLTIDGVSKRLAGHDLVVVIGAQVFRYYPFIPGRYLPEGTELLHVTCDPDAAAYAAAGDSALGDAKLAIELLIEKVAARPADVAPAPLAWPRQVPATSNSPLTPNEAYAALSDVRPSDAVLVNESTSTMVQQAEWLPTVRSGSFFASASGGIGWGVPAAVGVALGDRERGVRRPVIATIGDGSFQYSVQAVWTAAQHDLPIVFVVFRNGEYSILKSFARLEDAPGVPGLDLPGLDIASVAKGFGLRAVHADTTDEIREQFTLALDADGPTVIVIETQPQDAGLG
ncbi:benzoylformate decarboxylase [Kutzneria sp. CA-103260]|uniref:benzoylformate decarboxylase n=1 Tax=Kutzneria sp. CA-103260 TaxID=2802641 RepID=UPI001BA9DC55|nr:benzoylformate decarboxylase [Kutzneria sp. CA-103260]QUQ67120.1 benzoylformate decarboxylase [Kutzneria sp. CA-103260]